MNLPLCPFPKVFPSHLNKDDLFFMQHAYNQAINAWNENEVPIGAVISIGDEIIASAYNQTRKSNDPTAHAEMIAITAAANAIGDWRLNECKLHVTKEPCPMCSGAVIMSRIGHVHYAFSDPKMGCLGGATNLHDLPNSNHKPTISSGVMEKECHDLVKSFLKYREPKRDKHECLTFI